MKEEFELIAPCHFGLEAVLKREIVDLGYKISEVNDGRVHFMSDLDGIARSNIFLRTTERILIKVGGFKACTFEELYQGIKSIEWERYIPINGRFWVKKVSSIKSKLFSPKDIQSISKKAMVDRLSTKYGIGRFAEDGEDYPIRISILKDFVTVSLDSSGESLHKRGYRKFNVEAPISETLAAALIMLTPWKKDRILVDPFCGSGTIPIEAAMIAMKIAPGVNRNFQAERWKNIIEEKSFRLAREEAKDREELKTLLNIRGYDISSDNIEVARKNAALAGVKESIHLQRKDVRDLSSSKKYGFIITNPPYGERIEEKDELPKLYSAMAESFIRLEDWSYYIITSYEDILRYSKKPPTKNRKIYNGMIKTYFYSFEGRKPNRNRLEKSVSNVDR